MSHTVQLRNLIPLSVALLFIRNIDAGLSDRRILPTEVVVREGEDVQVRLLKVLNDEVTCYVRTPLLVNCNLKIAASEDADCDERIHYWSVNSSCGFYITNVQKQDGGLWRLTARSDGEKVVDVVLITVLDKFDFKMAEAVEIAKGMTYTLMFNDDEYCIVQDPHDPSNIIGNMCNLEIKTVSAADNVSWNAIVGVRGQIEEVVKTINVSVFYEYVDSGYTVSTNPKAINIYCNYIAMDTRLSMCRFARSSANQKGLRLREGMRKGRYEYYGNGLDVGQCGLTIQSPKEKDYGLWYCLLNIPYKPPVLTVVEVLKPASFQQKHTKREVTSAFTSSVSPVITTLGNVLELECSSDRPLSYCWFSEPNGEVYKAKEESNTTTSDLPPESTYLGNCKVKIPEAEKKHNGTWICHMGPSSPDVELTEEIHVRIAETHLAAINKFVPHDRKIIFQCKTVPYTMTLTYCRFQSPAGFGININEAITESNAIEHDNVRYWFSGESLAVGDCGLIIEPTSLIHGGNWTCAAIIEVMNGTNESYDTIHFAYDEFISNVDTDSKNDNSATIIGSVLGSLGFILAVGVIIILGIKYKRRFNNRSLNQNEDDVSLDTMPTDISIFSRASINRNDGNNDSRSSHSSSNSNTTDNSNEGNNSVQLVHI